MAWLLFTFSYIAFCFLLYTLMNLKKLGIKLYHTRVLVEFLFCVGFAVAGFMFLK
jgi:hypothetical protein